MPASVFHRNPNNKSTLQLKQYFVAARCRKLWECVANGQWPFSCWCWLPFLPPDFNLAIDQTNKRPLNTDSADFTPTIYGRISATLADFTGGSLRAGIQ